MVVVHFVFDCFSVLVVVVVLFLTKMNRFVYTFGLSKETFYLLITFQFDVPKQYHRVFLQLLLISRKKTEIIGLD